MSISAARTQIAVITLSIIITALMPACESAPTTTQQPPSLNPTPAKDTGYYEIAWSATALRYITESKCTTWEYGRSTTKIDTNELHLTFSTSIPDSLPTGRIWYSRGVDGIDTIDAWKQSEKFNLHIEIDTARRLFITIRFSASTSHSSPSAPLYSSESSGNSTALLILRNVPYSTDPTGSLSMAIDSTTEHLYIDSLDIRGESYRRHQQTNSTTCTFRSLAVLPGIRVTSLQLTLRR